MRISLKSAVILTFVAAVFYAVLVDAQQASSLVPKNMLFARNLSCPVTDWSEDTTMRGRAPVGLVSGGTNAATIGTALINAENRAVGLHNHSVTEVNHTHTITEPNGGLGHTHPNGAGAISGQSTFDDTSTFNYVSGTGGVTASATTGTTINTNSSGAALNTTGAVAGTNLPFVQVYFCKKS